MYLVISISLCFAQLGFSVGSFQIDVVGGWRYMYGFGTPVAVLMGLGMWSLPASPRWLLLRAVQGKGSLEEYKEKAMLALSKLRGRPPGDKMSEKLVDDALLSVKTAYEDEKSGGNFLEVFQGPNLKALTIGGGLVLFQQVIFVWCWPLDECESTFVFHLIILCINVTDNWTAKCSLLCGFDSSGMLALTLK